MNPTRAVLVAELADTLRRLATAVQQLAAADREIRRLTALDNSHTAHDLERDRQTMLHERAGS